MSKKNIKDKDYFSQLVEFDRNNHKVNTMVFDNCSIWWILGFKGNKIYVNELCFSEEDRKAGSIKKYLEMFDLNIFCKDGGEDAFAKAAEIQGYLDSGMNIEEAMFKFLGYDDEEDG